MDEFFHRKSLDDYLSWKPELFSVAMKKATGAREDPRGFAHKKRRHERFCCSCREASDATYFQLGSGKVYRLLHWNIYTIA